MRADARSGFWLSLLTNDPAGADAGGVFVSNVTARTRPYPAATFLTSFTSANLMSGARSAV
jgi:hypothetical protein